MRYIIVKNEFKGAYRQMGYNSLCLPLGTKIIGNFFTLYLIFLMYDIEEEY